MLVELNIDALVGPTHHFGGLGVGNVASHEHAYRVSRPRQAALEGLKKADWVARLGIPQFVLLPPVRPQLDFLRQLGFGGSLREQLTSAWQSDPRAFSAACSGAFMWAANSATVSAAADTADGRLHITPANLISSWHRSTEAAQRGTQLTAMFANSPQVEIHAALPAIVPLRDEGAANHMRLYDWHGQNGCNIFTFGAIDERDGYSGYFPRQTRAACEAIARQHGLDGDRTFFLQQHPRAIAAGVFHNDVIATSHRNVLIHHELAFIDARDELTRMEQTFQRSAGMELMRIEVSDRELPLEDAVRSYFFNSQIVTPAADYGGSSPPRMVLISPVQCREIETARRLIEQLLRDERVPIDEVQFVSLEQSMAGGGGPACLRLRVPMDAASLGQLPRHWRLDARLVERLGQAIEQYYPDTLELKDLCDPECVEALMQIPGKLALLSKAA